ncbi:hypothetical protein P168DRAFT_325250 [Aspergillus campestris IBT 28561]|uniref:SRR1-like domain-containing protein n=1 Tax=Aspergillus campestris (strain IBT 28561) TaxID=1392248 RepID=A0A2I1D925_ASPC2|nr:uncharacterized protein P168DRAFT_325250 [Aspergillus campestris IBT 28561]PKY06375.1 hypothetical protein P168DRAFT_325250 [Aspergillus campestris IBT 28561]
MPHTSRKKRPTTSKRLQIADPSSGWTHITTTAHSSSSHSPSTSHKNNTIDELLPAESPPKLTLPILQSQFATHKQKYDLSATAQTLRSTIQNIFFHRNHPDDNNDNSNDNSDTQPPTEIICIGLGSLSGLLRGGWVDRRRVSMYQLAALVGIIECFETRGKTIPIYAQDPVFNTLDKALLSSLNITVVESPRAFEAVGPRTLLFCPGVERVHLKDMMVRGPGVVVSSCDDDDVYSSLSIGHGGRGDNHDGDGDGNGGDDSNEKREVRTRQGVKLPLFEEQESAFWGVGVYHY